MPAPWHCWRRRRRGWRSLNIRRIYIKKSVVGAGHAGKEQVLFMVKRLLPACGVTQTDAADALAAAITHAHLSGTRAKMMAAL